MTTRFELGEQFVELSLLDDELHRAWGVRGRGRGSRVDRYDDAKAAQHAWKLQVRRFARRGFRVGFHDERFEALLRANPDDEQTYRTYADWLQERGDPRGLFIATMLAGLPHEALLTEHRDDLWPRVGYEVSYRWRWGYLERAEVQSRIDAERVLAHPSALVLKTLAFKATHARGAWWAQALNELLPRLPSTLQNIDLSAAPHVWSLRASFLPELLKLVTPVA